MRSLALAVLVACSTESGSESALARVEGDVYLLMQSGDTKRGSGLPVHLVRHSDSLESRLRAECRHLDSVAARLMSQHLEYSRRAQALHDRATRHTQAENYNQAAEAADAAAAQDRRASQAMREAEALTTTSAVNLRAILSAASSRVTTSGLAAHFTVDSIPPGLYMLVAEWPVGERSYRWLVPVTAVARQTLRQDLDHSNASEDALYGLCTRFRSQATSMSGGPS